MTKLRQLPAWQALQRHRDDIAGQTLCAMFETEPDRFKRFSIELDGLLFDYSKNWINTDTQKLLLELAEQADLPLQITRMFAGEPINFTENRPALHVALRQPSGSILVHGEDVLPQVEAVRQRVADFARAVQQGQWRGFNGQPITDVVNIGIGGSDLGPRMIYQALAPMMQSPLKAHFLSNVDGQAASSLLRQLNPSTTLFIVNSKSFSTLETFTNAKTARQWLLTQGASAEQAIPKHFVAVSSNLKAAAEFGLPRENCFPIWDWVGGRYSLWSASGMIIPLTLGIDVQDELLAGAAVMDAHFREAPLATNMPVIMGLLGIWYGDFHDAQTHAVLPYDERLACLPDHLQQLDMESNGKRARRDGAFVDYATGPIVWGAVGTNGQHAFFQLLHQGTHLVPADFIGCVRPHHALMDHHHKLLGNLLAQTKALMWGRNEAQTRAFLQSQGMSEQRVAELLPHQIFPGNRPSNTLLLQALTPRSLGMLVALYEHKVFVQGAIWNINSFDQWGVELGKRMANGLIAELEGGQSAESHDGSTQGLLDYCRRWSH